MSDFDHCSVCGEYDRLDRHHCPPAWEVRYINDDLYTDPTTCYAQSARGAAEIFAQKMWWQLGSPEGFLVEVRGKGRSLEWNQFRIEVEMKPTFECYQQNTAGVYEE